MRLIGKFIIFTLILFPLMLQGKEPELRPICDSVINSNELSCSLTSSSSIRNGRFGKLVNWEWIVNGKSKGKERYSGTKTWDYIQD